MQKDIRSRRGERGFTLIELLVVVLIIGILAAIAIPQYFKVVERARVAEAQAFVSSLKQAQERYLARNGTYVTATKDLATLDISFAGTCATDGDQCGMRYYDVKMAAGAACTDSTGWQIQLTRDVTKTAVASRYGNYTMVYDRCASPPFSYTGCKACTTACSGAKDNCELDFGQ